MMIRPVNFGFNSETAVNNAFQVAGQEDGAQEKALAEFDNFVELLRSNEIDVTVIDDTTLRRPLFSAQIDPDYKFVGFDVATNDALGDTMEPGWFFVLKERAGDIHFGLDIDPSATDPSWPILNDTAENNCIDVRSAGFKNLPGYTSDRSDRIASLLYQQPYMLFIHVSRIVS